MSTNLAAFGYLIAAICFVLALRGRHRERLPGRTPPELSKRQLANLRHRLCSWSPRRQGRWSA